MPERGWSALKLALNGSQDGFDAGRGGDGKGVILVDIVVGGGGGSRGKSDPRLTYSHPDQALEGWRR